MPEDLYQDTMVAMPSYSGRHCSNRARARVAWTPSKPCQPESSHQHRWVSSGKNKPLPAAEADR